MRETLISLPAKQQNPSTIQVFSFFFCPLDGGDVAISVLLSHVYDMKNFSQFKRSHLILVPRGEGKQNRQLQTKREREKATNEED